MEHVREAIRQVIEGVDFDSPEKLLRNIRPEQATRSLPFAPYSIGTNVAHTDHWNMIWLARLTGGLAPKTFPDFPDVRAEEWDSVRSSFLTNLLLAKAIVDSEPFNHRAKSDAAAAKLLLQMVAHTAYHLGQIKLLKRQLRLMTKNSE